MANNILIVFDTNKLLQNDSKNTYFSDFNLGGDYAVLTTQFIPKYLISGSIDVYITKLSVEEIKQQKIEKVKAKFDSLKKAHSKFNEDYLMIKHFLKKNTFHQPEPIKKYKLLIKNSFDKWLKKQKIKIIPFPKNSQFKKIITKAINRQAPFLRVKRKDGGDTDKGFKDVILWHSILDFTDLDKYNEVILFSEDGGFNLDCKTEFEDTKKIKFCIVKTFTDLLEQISNSLDEVEALNLFKYYSDYPTIVALIKDSDFKSKIINMINEQIGIGPISITNICISIEDLNEKMMIDFFSDDNCKLEDFSNIKVITSEININSANVPIKILIDSVSNEIETLIIPEEF
jgi:hypothetical protein